MDDLNLTINRGEVFGLLVQSQWLGQIRLPLNSCWGLIFPTRGSGAHPLAFSLPVT